MRIELDVPDELVPIFVEFMKSINNKFIKNYINDDVNASAIKERVYPTKEEVLEYVKTNNLCIDGNKFFEYYDKNHWTDKSGNQINDWKSLAKSWQYREFNANSKKTVTYTNVYGDNVTKELPLTIRR